MPHSTSTIERNVTRVSVMSGLLFLLLIASLIAVQALWERSGTTQSHSHAANASMQLGRLITFTASVLGFGLVGLAGRRIRSSVRALKEQNQVLMQLSIQLTQANASLEQTIATRTAALQSVLDNTGEGVLAVSPDGSLCDERSRKIAQWFGDATADAKIWDYLGGDDGSLRDRLYLGFDQIVEGVLPFEVSAEQAPSCMERNGQHWSLEYRQILEAGELDRVLVIVRDVTLQRHAAQAELNAREFHTLVGHLLRDRIGFQRAINECESLIEQLVHEQDIAWMRRKLHTLKGNAAMTGFQQLATTIHDLETSLDHDMRGLSTADLDLLRTQWNESLSGIAEYLRPEPVTSILVDVQELTSLVQSVRSGGGSEQVLGTLESWRLESIDVSLQRLAAQIQQTAKTLGKSIEVHIDGGNVRLDHQRFADFWSTMVHVVANAVDHGIEYPATRLVYGKPVTGRITLQAQQTDECVRLLIEDDGRGIDWTQVKTLAAAQGMPCTTQQELTQALFADRFSTRMEADEISGRGIGLSAVRAACEAVGGEVSIQSTAGHGTRFEFTFPLNPKCDVPVVAPEQTLV